MTMHRYAHKIVTPALLFVGVLCFWSLFRGDLFPSPSAVGAALVDALRTGTLIANASVSLWRVFVGFLLAVIVGVPFGLLMGSYREVRVALNPFVQLLHTVSPIAWIPLAILWFGIGNASAYFIIFMAALFPVLIATALAVRHIDPVLFRVGNNFGIPQRIMLTRITLPAITSSIASGLRISLGISWIVVVAAEMVGMNSGLGFMILDARNFLRLDVVIAVMFTIGVMGFALDLGMAWLERTLLHRFGGFTLHP